jgi:starvation-inducible DNA-binding protein
MTMSKKTKAAANGRLFPSRIDLQAEKRDAAIVVLNQILADLFDLHSQVKQAHWNVKGSHFHSYHLLFDETAGVLGEFIDEVAERATALGGYARGTARMAAGASRLKEFPDDVVEDVAVINVLVERFAYLAKEVRVTIDVTDALDDAGTADLFTALSRELDKRLWFLEAHIQVGT